MTLNDWHYVSYPTEIGAMFLCFTKPIADLRGLRLLQKQLSLLFRSFGGHAFVSIRSHSIQSALLAVVSKWN